MSYSTDKLKQLLPHYSFVENSEGKTIATKDDNSYEFYFKLDAYKKYLMDNVDESEIDEFEMYYILGVVSNIEEKFKSF